MIIVQQFQKEPGPLQPQIVVKLGRHSRMPKNGETVLIVFKSDPEMVIARGFVSYWLEGTLGFFYIEIAEEYDPPLPIFSMDIEDDPA